MTSLRAFLSRICAHCRPLRGETKEPAGDNISMIFMETGSQYYTTARFAMHAQCMPVCGNLFHHAVDGRHDQLGIFQTALLGSITPVSTVP